MPLRTKVITKRAGDNARNTSSPLAISDTNSESESDEDDEPTALPSLTPLLFTDEDNEPAASPTPTPTPFLFRNSATLSKKVPLDWLRDELENENNEDDRPAPIKTKRDSMPMKRKDGAMIRESQPSKLRLLRNNLRRQL
ncbi:hypothetical protein PZA11_004283 [Diplocarpon coronariae]